MKTVYRLKVFAFALIIAAAGFFPAVAYGCEAKQYSEGIIEYNLQKTSADSVQEWIDRELTRDAGEGSEWYIIALSNHGNYDFSAYNIALNNYLSENEVGSASSRLKYALTYIAINDKTNPYIDKVLNNSIGNQGIMSLVFGLHLLNNGYICDYYTVNELIDELISLQLSDGGWSITGEHGDVDVTAMTVQALAVHCNRNPAVKATVDAALDFLSARQLENGGYSAYGVENPESAAQVIIALSSLGIDVCADDRFIKNGNTVFDGISSFLLTDGSFCHKEGGLSEATSTVQVLCASVSYENMKNGKLPFYIFHQDKNISKETTTNAITTDTTLIQITLPESTSTIETSILVENSPETINTTLLESDTTKTNTSEADKGKTDSIHFIIISVCVVSTFICALIFAAKKYKLIVPLIIATVSIIALFIGISGNDKTDTIGEVTISINCAVIKNEYKDYIPENGVILEETEMEIEYGDTVYDVLAEVCKKNNILFSSNMGYIEGINNIYEMDFGKSSGWIYFVNGESPSVGCGNYKLSDGDKILWCYTRDLGKDLDTDFEKEYN